MIRYATTQALRYFHLHAVFIHSSHSHSPHPCSRFAKDSEFRKVESSLIFRESASVNDVRWSPSRSDLALRTCVSRAKKKTRKLARSKCRLNKAIPASEDVAAATGLPILTRLDADLVPSP